MVKRDAGNQGRVTASSNMSNDLVCNIWSPESWMLISCYSLESLWEHTFASWTSVDSSVKR